MSHKNLLLFVMLLLVVGIFSTAAAEMSIAITNPAPGYVSPCQDLKITFDVKLDGKEFKEIRLYYNGLTKGVIRKEPYEYVWKSLQRGNYELKAMLKSVDNVEAWSAPVKIKVGPISSGEKLYNGSFECDTKMTNWGLQLNEGAQATATVIPDVYFDDVGYLLVEITNGGSATWHIQLNQPCPTDSGHIYQIFFFADADVKKPIDVGMQENQSPWASQLWQGTEIDGANLYGPFEFESTRTDPTNVFRLNIGGNTTTCYLDGFSIIDLSASSVKSKELNGFGSVVSEFELAAAYPNPFNMSAAVPYSLTREAHIRLAIYDMQGRLIKSLVDGVQTPGSHTVYWEGTDENGQIVPSGVYVYRLEAKGRIMPVHLTRKIALVK